VQIPFDPAACALGGLGAGLFEASRWVGFRTQKKLPAYMYQLHYWLLTGVLIALGGALAGMMGTASWKEAFFIGISAPSIVARIAAMYPRSMKLGSAVAPGAPERSTADWLSA